MLEPCTDLSDTDTIESCYFERSVRLAAFHRVEATLTVVVITATDHISLTCEEQGV